MEKINIIGLDLAKSPMQVHAARADGLVVFRRKMSSGDAILCKTIRLSSAIVLEGGSFASL